MATTTGVVIDKSVKVIALQFSIPNPAAMPPSVRYLPQETSGERQKRKELAPGISVIPETPNVQVVDFVAQIAGLGYKLVSAIAQERPNLPGVFVAQSRNRVRYVLIPSKDVERGRTAPDLKVLMEGLMELCLSAMWTIRVHLNPYRKGDVESPDLYCLDIVLGARQPFCDRNGRPLMARPRGADGKTLKDAAPQSLVPDFLMKIVDCKLALVPNT